MRYLEDQRSRRLGLTLIELLVAVGILGVLAALVLVGIAGTRQSARRAQCANNLKQLGIAMTGYESAAGCFPPGQNGQNYYSLFASMLPQLEQTALYNAINFEVPSVRLGPDNLTVSCISLQPLLCPSDRGPPNKHAWTNYAGNEGFDLQAFGFNGSFTPTAGNPFVRRKGPPTLGPRDFADGTSMTVAVCEWALGPAHMAANEPLRSIYATDKLQRPGQFDEFITACLRVGRNGRRINNRGMVWFTGMTSRTLYNHNISPNHISCTNNYNATLGAITAGSQHPGGLNALYVDGHVAGVSFSVSTTIWRAIGTRNGGEVVGTY